MLVRLVVAVLVLVFGSSQGARAQAGQWFTAPTVLKAFFPDSERVDFVTIDPAALKAQGVATSAKQHHVYVAWTGTHIDGYAVLDDERGQHEPISFALQFDPTQLSVQRIEVMAYREAYGAEIRAARYRKQFIGKTRADFTKPVVDVDAISGATLSCKSTVAVVRRAFALVALAKESLMPAVAGTP